MRTSRASLFCFLAILILTTLGARAAAPTALTLSPTNITTNSAMLRGSVNPNGLATTARFQWGLTTNYGNTTTAQSVGAGAAPVEFQAAISPLLTDTNYHCRLVASSIGGTTYSSDVIVTPTLLLYLYAGESWTYEFHDLPFVGTHTLPGGGSDNNLFIVEVLPGSFGPGSSLQIEAFANGTNDCCGYGPVLLNYPGTGTNYQGNGAWIADLQGVGRITVLTGSVVVASASFYLDHHDSGIFWSAYANSFAPTRNPQPPLVSTQFVSSANAVSAAVQASVNARNLSSSVFVQWGATTNYGSVTSPTFVDRDYAYPVAFTVSNLAPATLYHLRVVATNSAGATYGNDLALTTAFATTAVTLPATGRTTNAATLNASIAVNGIPTTSYFQWGLTTNYDQITPLQALGSSPLATNVSERLSGLALNTVYHFRALAYALGVTNYGADLSFRTTLAPTNLVVTNLTTADVRGAIERGGTVTFACDGVLVLSNQVEIANDVCLDATGHAITFSGSNVTRLFLVRPGTLFTLTNLTLADGRSTNGGAVYNEGMVVARNCWFTGNLAVGTNGIDGTNGLNGTSGPTTNLVTIGSSGQGGTDGQSASGGAIYSLGTVDLTACYFTRNQVLGGKGGKGGTGGNGGHVTPNGGYMSGGAGGAAGRAGDASGGCVTSFGTLVVSSCVFSNSFAGGGDGGNGGRGGGGSGFPPPGLPQPTNGPCAGGESGGTARGGTIFSVGACAVSNSFIVMSTCLGGGGGAAGHPVTSVGETARAEPNAGFGGLAQGGATFSTGNSTISGCTLWANQATGGPGGIGGDYPGRGGDGGSAYGGASLVGSTSLVVNCTLATNLARGGMGAPSLAYNDIRDAAGGNGGDAYGGGLSSLLTCSGLNLTLAGNSTEKGLATETNFTGFPYPPLKGTNGNDYGHSIGNTGGVFQIANSILAGGTSNNAWGAITDLGHNISSDATPVWASGISLNNTDPLLLPLANNGGQTMTMALRVGSPALNTADCAATPATDQRGVVRPDGPGCDIGAYEGAGAFALQVWHESAATNMVRHAAEAGRAYRLEKTTLFDTWLPVVTNIAPAGGWLEFHVPATGSPCFYRVLAQ